MQTVTKKHIVDRVAQITKVNRSMVRDVIREFLGQVTDELAQGRRLEFRHFGVFEPRERAPRTAQNPRTLERVMIPGRVGVRFKAAREMRDKIEANGNPGGLDGAGPAIEVKPRRR